MKKSVLLLNLLFWFVAFSSAQKTDLNGVFAYVYNLNSSTSNEFATPNSAVQKVFDDLVMSKGVSATLTPQLVIARTESMAAWAKPENRTIGLEQKAYDICRSLGADSLNAVAGLLAHELIHYYENHNWQNHFIRNYTDLSPQESVDANAGKQMEMEADEMGGLLAHMAGYNALDVMPKLLNKIYTAYNLDKNSSEHYPDLASRMKMAEISTSNLGKLIPIFEMANYFLVTGAENEAQFYLEYILNSSNFQSRELHNNLGVIYALKAYDQRPNQNLKYAFPFQLDLESRLSTKGVQTEFEKNSKTALRHFENAVALDESYTTGMLNIVAIHILREEFPDAEYRLYKVESELGKDNPSILGLRGLLAAYKGDVDAAKTYWEEAASKGNDMAKANLSVLQGQNISAITNDNYQMPYIDQIDLNKLYSMILKDEVAPDKSVELTENTSFYSVVLDNSEIYIHLDYGGDEKFSFFHIVKQNNLDLPLNIGDDKSALFDQFGKPDIMLETNGGTICNFKSYNLIAVIKDNVIKNWCTYKLNLQ